MSTQKEKGDWIENSMMLTGTVMSAVNGVTAASYHEFFLHEEDQIADGRMTSDGPDAAHRRRLRESFEAQHPVLAELLRTQHSEQPPHYFYIPPTAEEILDEEANFEASRRLVYLYDDHLDIYARARREGLDVYDTDNDRYVSGKREGLIDYAWEELAEDCPKYSQQSRGLGQRLKLVEEMKKNSSQEQEEQAQLRTLFSSVSDNLAQQFLTDILISRRIIEPGIIDTRVSYQTEANHMASELGFSEGWQGRNITTRQIAGAVLKGRLSINYQPPLSQSSARRPGQ